MYVPECGIPRWDMKQQCGEVDFYQFGNNNNDNNNNNNNNNNVIKLKLKERTKEK